MDIDDDPRDYMSFAEEQALEREDRAKRFVEQQHSGALTDADRDEGYSDPYYYDEQYDDDEFDEYDYEDYEDWPEYEPPTRIEAIRYRIQNELLWFKWKIRHILARYGLRRCQDCGRLLCVGDHTGCVPF